MIRLRITFRGFGGRTMPVATIMSTLSLLSDYSVKHSTLLGVKTIGHIAVATAYMSLRKNRMYLSFSLDEPGLVSALNIG